MASMIEYRQKLAERDLASVWPQWRIVRLLGAGAFGEVYEIQRTDYGRVSRCALKILRRENTPPSSSDIYTNISRGNSAEEFISTVLREIDIMEKLKGAPNIVVIDDYEVTRNSDSCSVLIRMELLRNLGELMASRPITIADVIRIGTDVCNALEYCEGQNIIHRDVKESNIFYSDMGMFKLGDFGISRQLSNYLMNSATMTSAGTVSKMAPEVYRGEKYDNRVDIYSLGIVLYSLLNYGRPPFYPPYPAEVSADAAFEADMMRIKGTPVPPLTSVDDSLNKIICKACNPKASGRYRTAAQFREALLSYYEEISANHNPYTPADPTQENKSNLLPGIVLVASLAVIVGSLAVWNVSRGGTKQTPAPVTQTYIAENTVQETNSVPEVEEKNDAAEEEIQQDNYLHADWSDEKEESGMGGGGGSGLSVKRMKDFVKSPQGGEEVQKEEDGSYALIDGDGDTVAKVEMPSWASDAETNDGSVSFTGGLNAASYMFVEGISAHSYMTIVKELLNEETLGIEKVEILDTGTSSTSDLTVEWVKIGMKDGSAYGTAYYGAVSCEGGCIQAVSIRLGGSPYPDFSESDYLPDVECITLVE